jgi:RNase P subunit RPR2
MEVHHHTHHPKRWKEYFWEFFMLFLAVFCGFLAEYQLEHKIEKDRARKYMKDMVENLKYDTVRLGRNFRRNTMKCQYLDSFRNEIQLALEGKNNVNQLYYYWIKTKSYNYVAFNKSTVTQLTIILPH